VQGWWTRGCTSLCGAAGPAIGVALPARGWESTGFVDLELAPYSAVGLTWRVALSFDDAFREASLVGRMET